MLLQQPTSSDKHTFTCPLFTGPWDPFLDCPPPPPRPAQPLQAPTQSWTVVVNTACLHMTATLPPPPQLHKAPLLTLLCVSPPHPIQDSGMSADGGAAYLYWPWTSADMKESLHHLPPINIRGGAFTNTLLSTVCSNLYLKYDYFCSWMFTSHFLHCTPGYICLYVYLLFVRMYVNVTHACISAPGDSALWVFFAVVAAETAPFRLSTDCRLTLQTTNRNWAYWQSRSANDWGYCVR